MKRTILFIQFLFLVIAANATGQEGDIIYIDGTRWELLGRPIYADSLLSKALIAELPKERATTTANWDGFIAYWSIKKDVLYLDSVQCEYSSRYAKGSWWNSIPSITLLRVFNKHITKKGIVASWLTNDIRIAKGKMIYYQHSGFMRNYENEQIISINKGKVIKKKVYHNYVIDGLSFDKEIDYKELGRLFPFPIEKYPELANETRLEFFIKKARTNSLGHLVECEVKVLKPADNQRLANEMAAMLKAYHPWKVSYINGEFRGYGIEGVFIPYRIRK